MSPARSGEWGDLVVYDSLRQIFLRKKHDQQTAIFRCRTIKDPTGQPVAIRLDEWKGVVELYGQSKISHYLNTARPGRPFRMGPLADRVLNDPRSKLFKLTGRALFADSTARQRRYLERLKKLSRKGNNASREFVAALRSEIQVMHRQHRPRGVWSIYSKIIPYRAERRLLWLFIRSELIGAGWEPKDYPSKSVMSWLRPIVGEMLTTLPWLSTFYDLDIARIVGGVYESEQADKETAKRFRFKSANALQKFLSTYRPSS